MTHTCNRIGRKLQCNLAVYMDFRGREELFDKSHAFMPALTPRKLPGLAAEAAGKTLRSALYGGSQNTWRGSMQHLAIKNAGNASGRANGRGGHKLEEAARLVYPQGAWPLVVASCSVMLSATQTAFFPEAPADECPEAADPFLRLTLQPFNVSIGRDGRAGNAAWLMQGLFLQDDVWRIS